MAAKLKKKEPASEGVATSSKSLVESDSLQRRSAWIATAAYFLAEKNQAQGRSSNPLQDWLDAEEEYVRTYELRSSTGHQHHS